MSDAPGAKPLLVFLNEVAGGRKLLAAVQERAEKVPFVAVAAPQNQPAVGQLIDSGELRDAARARVEVTMSVLSEYGIESVGEVMDPEPSLALDDAVRAHEPGEVLLHEADHYFIVILGRQTAYLPADHIAFDQGKHFGLAFVLDRFDTDGQY